MRRSAKSGLTRLCRDLLTATCYGIMLFLIYCAVYLSSRIEPFRYTGF